MGNIKLPTVAELEEARAIEHVESRGNPNAVSPKGARGPMQIMPATARDPGYGVPDVFTIADRLGVTYPDKSDNSVNTLLANTDVNRVQGTLYKNAMNVQAGGDLTLARRMYNGGPGAVAAAGGVLPNKENQDYPGLVSQALNPSGQPMNIAQPQQPTTPPFSYTPMQAPATGTPPKPTTLPTVAELMARRGGAVPQPQDVPTSVPPVKAAPKHNAFVRGMMSGVDPYARNISNIVHANLYEEPVLRPGQKNPLPTGALPITELPGWEAPDQGEGFFDNAGERLAYGLGSAVPGLMEYGLAGTYLGPILGFGLVDAAHQALTNRADAAIGREAEQSALAAGAKGAVLGGLFKGAGLLDTPAKRIAAAGAAGTLAPPLMDQRAPQLEDVAFGLGLAPLAAKGKSKAGEAGRKGAFRDATKADEAPPPNVEMGAPKQAETIVTDTAPPEAVSALDALAREKLGQEPIKSDVVEYGPQLRPDPTETLLGEPTAGGPRRINPLPATSPQALAETKLPPLDPEAKYDPSARVVPEQPTAPESVIPQREVGPQLPTEAQKAERLGPEPLERPQVNWDNHIVKPLGGWPADPQARADAFLRQRGLTQEQFAMLDPASRRRLIAEFDQITKAPGESRATDALGRDEQNRSVMEERDRLHDIPGERLPAKPAKPPLRATALPAESGRKLLNAPDDYVGTLPGGEPVYRDTPERRAESEPPRGTFENFDESGGREAAMAELRDAYAEQARLQEESKQYFGGIAVKDENGITVTDAQGRPKMSRPRNLTKEEKAAGLDMEDLRRAFGARLDANTARVRAANEAVSAARKGIDENRSRFEAMRDENRAERNIDLNDLQDERYPAADVFDANEPPLPPSKKSTRDQIHDILTEDDTISGIQKQADALHKRVFGDEAPLPSKPVKKKEAARPKPVAQEPPSEVVTSERSPTPAASEAPVAAPPRGPLTSKFNNPNMSAIEELARSTEKAAKAKWDKARETGSNKGFGSVQKKGAETRKANAWEAYEARKKGEQSNLFDEPPEQSAMAVEAAKAYGDKARAAEILRRQREVLIADKKSTKAVDQAIADLEAKTKKGWTEEEDDPWWKDESGAALLPSIDDLMEVITRGRSVFANKSKAAADKIAPGEVKMKPIGERVGKAAAPIKEAWLTPQHAAESQLGNKLLGRAGQMVSDALGRAQQMSQRIRRDVESRITRDDYVNIRRATEIIFSRDQARIDKAMKLNPNLMGSAQAVIDIFREYRPRIKESMRQELFNRYEETRLGDTLRKAIDDNVRGDDLTELAKANKVDAEMLSDLVGHYDKIDSWGIEDYITNVEMGGFKITGYKENGQTVTLGWGETGPLAARKAHEAILSGQFPDVVRWSAEATNPKFGHEFAQVSPTAYRTMVRKAARELRKVDDELTALGAAAKIRGALGHDIVVKPTRKFAPPLRKRMNTLMGEKDIVPVLHSYASWMERAIALNPEVARYKRWREMLPENDQKLMENYLDDMKGVYSVEDKIFDEMLSGTFLRPGSYSRGLGLGRSVVAAAKLGLRPVAIAVNTIDSNLRTLVQTDFDLTNWRNAMKWRETPEGKAFVERNRFKIGAAMSEIEANSAQFGKGWLTSYETMTSAVKNGNYRLAGKEAIRLADPRNFYSFPEPWLREQALAANYLKLKEKSPNMKPEQLEFDAVEATRVAQIIYDLGNQSRWMRRSPTLRAALMFKQYLIGSARWLGTLDGKQLGKYLAVNGLVAGPSYYVALAKSVPLIGALLPWEDIEKGMSEIFGSAYFGAAGAMGGDITAPYTPQLPNRTEDLLGPMFGDLKKIYDYGMSPEKGPRDFEKLKKDLIPAYGNIVDAIDSTMTENGWIEDEKGNKKFQLDTPYKRILRASGVKPIEQSQRRIVDNAAYKDNQRRLVKQERVITQALDEYEETGGFSSETRDKMQELGVSPSTIQERALQRGLEPEQRTMRRTRKRDRPGLLEDYEAVGLR